MLQVRTETALLDHFINVRELLAYQRTQVNEDLPQLIGVLSSYSSFAQLPGSVLSVHHETGNDATWRNRIAIGDSL
jgi:hypothetical protein